MRRRRKGKMDPITFEVLRNGFRAMCTQGSTLLERVAYGPVITEGHDYAVGLLTADGRLVGHGTRDITPHMGTFEASVRCVLEDFETIRPGTQSAAEYDRTVRDLVNFMVWMGEPAQVKRKQLGVFVLMVIGILIVLSYLLYKEYWKDVH